MVLRPESAQPYSSTRYIWPVDNRRNVVPIGQRDQSAAALPIIGAFATAIARFATRVAFVTRVVVLTRLVVLVSSIENGWRTTPEFDTRRISTSSLSETGIARKTFSARRIGAPAACNSPPSAL